MAFWRNFYNFKSEPTGVSGRYSLILNHMQDKREVAELPHDTLPPCERHPESSTIWFLPLEHNTDPGIAFAFKWEGEESLDVTAYVRTQNVNTHNTEGKVAQDETSANCAEGSPSLQDATQPTSQSDAKSNLSATVLTWKAFRPQANAFKWNPNEPRDTFYQLTKALREDILSSCTKGESVPTAETLSQLNQMDDRNVDRVSHMVADQLNPEH